MRNPFAYSYHWSKRIWAPNPFVVLLRKAQTDLAIRIWTILVPIRLKKNEKNGFGPFSYKFFVCIRVGFKSRPKKLFFAQHFFIIFQPKYFVKNTPRKKLSNCAKSPRTFVKNLNAPPSRGKMSKRLGGIRGWKHKTSWHLNGFPYGNIIGLLLLFCCCFLTLTDPLRIQPWSQDRRNQTKSNRESEMSMESIQKRTGKK